MGIPPTDEGLSSPLSLSLTHTMTTMRLSLAVCLLLVLMGISHGFRSSLLPYRLARLPSSRSPSASPHRLANQLATAPAVDLTDVSAHAPSTTASSISKSLPLQRIAKLTGLCMGLLHSLWPSTASAASSAPVLGWDLYGRVPYDDWLFTTDKLLDPNLLRRSMVEAFVAEIPHALSSFERRRNIKGYFAGLRIIAVVIAVFAAFLKVGDIGQKWARSIRQRENAVRGFETPIAANYKPEKRPDEPEEKD